MSEFIVTIELDEVSTNPLSSKLVTYKCFVIPFASTCAATGCEKYCYIYNNIGPGLASKITATMIMTTDCSREWSVRILSLSIVTNKAEKQWSEVSEEDTKPKGITKISMTKSPRRREKACEKSFLSDTNVKPLTENTLL